MEVTRVLYLDDGVVTSIGIRRRMDQVHWHCWLPDPAARVPARSDRLAYKSSRYKRSLFIELLCHPPWDLLPPPLPSVSVSSLLGCALPASQSFQPGAT